MSSFGRFSPALDPAVTTSPPGSVWWRGVNERLLRDGWETVARLGGFGVLVGRPRQTHAHFGLRDAQLATL